MELSQEELSCLQALRTSEYEEFKDRNPNRLEGTCEWFYQHNHYQEWQRSNTGLLWVTADPGCGKSVLAKSLVEDHKGIESQTTCYFFFKDDNDKQKSLPTALSALLHQLFSQKQSLIRHAIQDYNAEGNQLSHSFHKLWDILVRATSDPKAGEVVCILDALDECVESGRHQIIDALSALYKELPSTKSGSKLKFLVTGRPYSDIERRFASLVHRFPTIRLSGESESISSEINIVVKWEVSELARDLELDNSERSILELELLSMTHRTYLWLKLIIEVIREEISLTKTKLKQIIRTLPLTVDQAYEAILSKVKDQKRARKLLHLVIAAIRPLTLREMNMAMAIEGHHQCLNDLDVENEIRFRSSVRNLCGFFVTVMDQKVYLIHQTAKEFLLTRGEAVSSYWKHSLNPVDSNLLMATACITYLKFVMFIDEIDLEIVKQHDFYNYAACFWATHFREAQSTATRELAQSVIQICNVQTRPFRHWFYDYYLRTTEYASPDFASAIMVASYFGHQIVVEQLLMTGKVDVDSMDGTFGRTSLFWAAARGREAVVRLLLATGRVDVNSKDNYGGTPLSWAAARGDEAVVRLLLATGKVNVNSKNVDGQTPLSLAAMNGTEAVVKLLIEREDVNASLGDNDGRTPLSYAAQYDQDAVVRLLLATGKVNVKSKDANGQTPLSLAAMNGHEAAIKLLIEREDVNADLGDNDGRTPLSYAAECGHEAIVTLLLSSDRITPNSKDSGGCTPLIYASLNGHNAVVTALLSHFRTNPDLKDYFGSSALSIATRHCHTEVVKMLLATQFVDIHSRDCLGRTPLWWARRRGSADLEELLLQHLGKGGISADENEAPITTSFRSYGGYTRWCDICTFDILKGEVFYQCTLCVTTNTLDICSECYTMGGRCLNGDHDLALKMDESN